MRAFAAISACVVLTACHKNTSTEPGAVAVADASPVDASSVDSGIAPARCHLGGVAATLPDVGDPRAVVLGESVPTSDGLAVGLVHSPTSGMEAMVARIAGRDVKTAWVVARGALLIADAPPPKPLVTGAALYAVAVETGPRSGDAGPSAPERRIVLAKEGAEAPIASYPERADELLSFDAAPSADGTAAALAWDEDAAVGGGITVGVVSLADGHALPQHVVSVGTEDPELPRLAPRAGKDGGWWAFWIARHAELLLDASAGARAAEIETPAEPSAVAWIEVVGVDRSGLPVSAPKRLTSPTGHAASFDLAPQPQGGVDVVVRDETQPREGEGGRIFRVSVGAEGNVGDPTLLAVGAGRGSVDVLGTSDGRAWVSFTDAQDRAMVAPLPPPGAGPAALPSVEAVLDGGRLLGLLPASPPLGPSAGDAAFLAAFPSNAGGGGSLFREVTCSR